uniref:Uncharacterized protein n=1 Tax=Anguilla anguilla TaxID=7936 RepID=A0A0E9X5P6_ANGAN
MHPHAVWFTLCRPSSSGQSFFLFLFNSSVFNPNVHHLPSVFAGIVLKKSPEKNPGLVYRTAEDRLKHTSSSQKDRNSF